MASPAPTLIHVHGAGLQPPQADWLRVHDELLFVGGARVATDLAYYADLLTPRGDVRESQAPGTPAARDMPAGADEVLHPSVEAAGQHHRAHAFLLRLAAAMGPTDHRSRFALPDPVIPPAVRTFYREVSGYFHGEPTLAEGMRERFRAAMRRHPERVVVLAHSLGSVVAYDALGEPEFAGREVTLLTVGSPLGLGPTQDHLQAWRGSRPVELPGGVGLWRNFHAEGDPVAHGSDQDGLRRDYAPAERVHATAVRSEAEWHHALAGYLQAPEVQEAVLAHMLGRRRR
jgi:hypothetical protein